MQPNSRLTRQDNQTVPADKNEVRLFCKFRNEAVRLPYFLSYHRNLGVNRFFFVDNGSSDESADFLLEQSDCYLFSTDEKMSEARAGMDWLEPLLDTYGKEHWCLVADADELLVYPESESVPLPAFCQGLDQQGVNALICMMIDMYPEGNAEEVQYQEGQSFLEACPFLTKVAISTGKNKNKELSLKSSADLS